MLITDLLAAASAFPITRLSNGTADANSAFDLPQPYANRDSNFNFNMVPSFSGGLISSASPLGMDLGEFILEDDIRFLNQLASAGVLTGTNKVNDGEVINGVIEN